MSRFPTFAKDDRTGLAVDSELDRSIRIKIRITTPGKRNGQEREQQNKPTKLVSYIAHRNSHQS